MESVAREPNTDIENTVCYTVVHNPKWRFAHDDANEDTAAAAAASG